MSNNMIALIVARSKNNVVGKNGRIPWQIPGEQKQFKELTTGNIVIMGRKSYEEIGHSLPGRKTIVISRTKKFEGPALATATSVKDALDLAANGFARPNQNIYIAGCHFDPSFFEKAGNSFWKSKALRLSSK